MSSLFFASNLNKKSRMNIYSRFAIMIALMVIMSSCEFKVATIRSIDEDEEAKRGFVPTDYVQQIWDGQFMETILARSVEFTELMGLIAADEDATIAAHGSRSGTGSYSFVTHGQAQVLEVNTESRIGFMTLDMAPFDGQADALMAIGPVIRGRDVSLLDAVGFIQFNDFTNQTEFAGIADALKERVLTTVVSQLDLNTIVGQTINFYGTFTWSDPNKIEIVPVSIEVVES
jgi:predicted lipoprotein